MNDTDYEFDGVKWCEATIEMFGHTGRIAMIDADKLRQWLKELERLRGKVEE